MVNTSQEPMSLPELLAMFEGRTTSFTAPKVFDSLSGLRARAPEIESDPAWFFEWAAFAMRLDREDEVPPWSCPFRPLMSLPGEDGTLRHTPDAEKFTGDVLSYWRTRAKSAGNPILVARYADLAWVFAKGAGMPRDIADARLAHNAYLDAARALITAEPTSAIDHGLRALRLAKAIGDSDGQGKAKDTLFEIARTLEKDPKPLFRGFLMEHFGVGAFSRVPLTGEELDYMVWLLEDQLERHRRSDPEEGPLSVWVPQHAVQELVPYYNKRRQQAEVNRLLESLGEVVYRRALKADPAVGQAWLEQYARYCSDNGRKDLATQAIQKLREMGGDVVRGLEQVQHEIEVPEEQLKAYLDRFVESDLPTALGRFAIHMTPKWAEVEALTRESSERFVFYNLAGTHLLDPVGRPAVYVPPYGSNPDAYLQYAYGERLHLQGFFRSKALERIRGAFHPTAEDVTDWLYRSPAFIPERRQMISEVIRHYLAGDALVAVHLIVPQVEDAARTFAGLLGESVFEQKKDENGSRMDARSLHHILCSEGMARVFGEDYLAFLRVALVVPQGLNLRNRVAHGLMFLEEFTAGLADIAFQCLLILGLPRAAGGG